MTVLVTAASKHGATAEIGKTIASVLEEHGVPAEFVEIDDVGDLDGFDAFVVGSGIYMGNWLKHARRFLDAHAAELARRPTWLFASGPIVGEPPVADDPNALRAGLAERLVEATHAREHRLFAGSLDSSRLGLLEKAAVRAAHAREGDHRDWCEVHRWAEGIAAQLRNGTKGVCDMPAELTHTSDEVITRSYDVLARSGPIGPQPASRAEPRARTRTAPPERTEKPATLQVALLACGIAVPLLYVLTDVLLALRWEGYSYRDQTISELNAIGAPTRTLSIVLGIVGYTFLVAFGVGVWRSAAANRRLRVAAGALIALGVLGWFGVPFFPMHVREAEETLTDTLHVAQFGVVGPLLLVIFGFGAAALGSRFRLYTAATGLVMLTFGAWSGTFGADVANDLATPWLGVIERICVFSYQLWIGVFAIAILGWAFCGARGAGTGPRA